MTGKDRVLRFRLLRTIGRDAEKTKNGLPVCGEGVEIAHRANVVIECRSLNITNEHVKFYRHDVSWLPFGRFRCEAAKMDITSRCYFCWIVVIDRRGF